MRYDVSDLSLSPFASATALAAAIAERRLSSRELTEHYLDRIDRHNPALNAVVTLDEDGALDAADAADRALARGEATGPLHGLPITVKDAIETAGMRTACGAEPFANHIPEQDAEGVARLRKAGAIIFGKTNVPAFCGDMQTYNDLFGTTNNPWALDRTPGGSSGGAAAAVAAGLTTFELGSDIGGSLRIPAHFCGISTIKPSYGIVPVRGHIPPPPGTLTEPDICVIGPLARDPRDLDLILSALAGPDAHRAPGWRLELPLPRHDSLAGYRIAAWLDDSYCTTDRELLAVYTRLLDDLRQAGVSVVETTGPVPLSDGHSVAERLIQGTVSTWLPDDAFGALVERVATADPAEETPNLRWSRNITQRARDLQLVTEERRRHQASWDGFFQSYDLLLCPVSPTPAFPHDHNPDHDARRLIVNGAEFVYGGQFSWVQAIGVVHLPAVVTPAGRTHSGLPVGVQIVAPYLHDRAAIDFAIRLVEITGGFVPPPGPWSG